MFDLSMFPNLGENRPDLFAIQWDAVFEVLGAIVLLSLIVERFLSPIFESSTYINKQRQWDLEGKGNYKAPIAFLISLLACIATGVDILAVMSQSPQASIVGFVFSAGVVAGGSKGSIKLFRDFLDFKSTAYRDYKNEGSLAQSSSSIAPVANSAPTASPTVSGVGAVQVTPPGSATSAAPVVPPSQV